MSFQNQLHPNETIILQTRQHWFFLIPSIATALILLALLIIFALIVSLGGIALAVGGFAPGLILLLVWGVLLLEIIPLITLFNRTLVWMNEEYLITTHRVVKQEGVLEKASKDAPLDKINNVSHHQSFWGRLLGYGDVRLQTASEMGETIFAFIPSPLKFKNVIREQQESYKTAGLREQTKGLKEAMTAVFKEGGASGSSAEMLGELRSIREGTERNERLLTQICQALKNQHRSQISQS